ncbi:uncharacterized protein DUF1942 [Mycobacterium sp. BK558]|nr:uncharacterized protein DUF1942 [Mycobacterium sp. BK558]
MKIKPALVVVSAAAAVAVGMSGAPFASADPEVQYLGQPGELVNGNVVQHWIVTGLKPSTDEIPYQPAGALWEATATDEAVSGSVTPIVSNLNARAENGDTYRVLFGVATPQGVNPSTLAQGEKTTGKIYFDVTGEKPDSVFYSAGGPDQVLLWVEAPPAPATGSTGGRTPAWTGSSPSASGAAETAAPETSTTPTPGATAAAATPAPTATPVPAGSAGTPLPEGSSGTPLPAGSAGTPLLEGAAPAVEASPAPVPAAVNPAPRGSAGTPLPAGSTGMPVGSTPTPAPVTTTVVVPPPA